MAKSPELMEFERLMESKKWKPAEVARRTGLSRSAISQILHGTNKPTLALEALRRVVVEDDVGQSSPDKAKEMSPDYRTAPPEWIMDLASRFSALSVDQRRRAIMAVHSMLDLLLEKPGSVPQLSVPLSSAPPRPGKGSGQSASSSAKPSPSSSEPSPTVTIPNAGDMAAHALRLQQGDEFRARQKAASSADMKSAPSDPPRRRKGP